MRLFSDAKGDAASIGGRTYLTDLALAQLVKSSLSIKFNDKRIVEPIRINPATGAIIVVKF
jgi:hypothetical protein